MRRTNHTTVRYSSIMVRAEHRALPAFTSMAACMLSPKRVNIRDMSWNIGFPGGWPTSSL